MLLSRIGGDLLSRVLRRSTIGVPALNGRVRDGIGCFAGAMTTNPRKKRVNIGLLFWACRAQVWDLCLTGSGNAVFQVYAFGVVDLSEQVLLLLDQIKPIEQLVPVS